MSLRLDELIAVGLLIALAFTTLAHGAVEPWSVVVFESILILLLLLWGVKAALDRRLTMTIPTSAVPLAALLVLGVVQSVAWTAPTGDRASLSMDVEATRHAVAVAMFLATAPILAGTFFATRRRLFLLANTLTVFGALLAVFAMLRYLNWNGWFFWFRTDVISGPFVNPDHFAAYMTMLTPIPVALVLRFVPTEARLAYGFAAVLMGTAAVVSGSRSGLIGLTVAMLWMALMNERSRRALRTSDHALRRRFSLLRFGPMTAIATATTAGVFWIGSAPVIERLAEAFNQLLRSGTPDPARSAIWRGAINIIRDHPVMGAGFGAFNTIYPTYGERIGFSEVLHAHNDYLQAIAEGGAIAGMIVIWFVVAILATVHRNVQSRDPISSGAALAAGGGIIAILVQSLSQNDLQIPAIALMFFALVGVTSGIGEKQHQRT
jgi:O-antigen ligase